MSIWKYVSLLLLLYYPVWILHVLVGGIALQRTVHAVVDLTLVFWGIYAAKFGTAYGTAIGVSVGLSYLPLMAAMTLTAPVEGNHFRFRFGGWAKDVLWQPSLYTSSAFSCLREELVWRSAFIYLTQTIGIPGVVTVAAGSLLFYLLHLKIRKRIVVLTEIEFFLFCVLLYCLYLWTMSVLVTWFVHFARNSYLAFHRKTDRSDG